MFFQQSFPTSYSFWWTYLAKFFTVFFSSFRKSTKLICKMVMWFFFWIRADAFPQNIALSTIQRNVILIENLVNFYFYRRECRQHIFNFWYAFLYSIHLLWFVVIIFQNRRMMVVISFHFPRPKKKSVFTKYDPLVSKLIFYMFNFPVHFSIYCKFTPIFRCVEKKKRKIPLWVPFNAIDGI